MRIVAANPRRIVAAGLWRTTDLLAVTSLAEPHTTMVCLAALAVHIAAVFQEVAVPSAVDHAAAPVPIAALVPIVVPVPAAAVVRIVVVPIVAADTSEVEDS